MRRSLAWTFRAFPKRHAARLGAVLSTVFMFSEALIGATLVKFGLVAHDASPARAAVLLVASGEHADVSGVSHSDGAVG